jgi:hypothetical protein
MLRLQPVVNVFDYDDGLNKAIDARGLTDEGRG